MIKPLQPPCGRGKQASLALLEKIHSPFGALRHHLPAPVGSVSHDSQVALLPYESCSLATAERWDNKALKGSPFISSSQHNGAL